MEDSPEEVLEMAIDADPAIAKAESILEELGSLDEVKKYYDYREKLVRDEISRLEGAKAEGEQIGIEKGEQSGIEKGKQIGIEKGEQIGIEKEKRSTARKLIAMGLSIPDIAKATGLDEEAILKLK